MLQSVGQGDGAGGVGHEERTHDEHDDTQHHLHGGNDALPCDVAHQPHVRHRRTVGKEHIHDGGEGHDEIDRLQAPCQCLPLHTGDEDAHRQHGDHDAVGQGAFCVEQRYDVQNDAQQLRPGIQLVDKGVAGEILAQRDILQHTSAPPFSRSSASRSASTVYTAVSTGSPRCRRASATFVTCGISSPTCSSSWARANT